MHIKSITLSGFKSYRDPVTLELDPRHNVIIGRNGYGKSNIFDGARDRRRRGRRQGGCGAQRAACRPLCVLAGLAHVPAASSLRVAPLVAAIRFVFGDQFGAMRADDKTKLIFVRSGPPRVVHGS
jgi:hypothetical protein